MLTPACHYRGCSKPSVHVVRVQEDISRNGSELSANDLDVRLCVEHYSLIMEGVIGPGMLPFEVEE